MVMETNEKPRTKRCKGNGKYWFGAGLLAIVATVALVGACGRGGCHGGHRDFDEVRKFASWRLDDLLDDLDATDAQRVKIQTAAKDVLDDIEGMKKQHDSNKGQVFADFQAGREDPERLHALIDERFAEANGFAHRTLDRLLAAYNVLTPDQKQDVLDEWAEHMEDHR
jgi:Spy/CpxP family protein refolding chaperone